MFCAGKRFCMCAGGFVVGQLVSLIMSVCLCVCACARITKLELLQGQKKRYHLTGNPKLFHWRERENNEKILQWYLHVYVVCECRRYLGILAAE